MIDGRRFASSEIRDDGDTRAVTFKIPYTRPSLIEYVLSNNK